MSAVDIAPHLDHGPWRSVRTKAVVLASLAIVFDGFDNQVLGFALPAITRDWGVERSAFGTIFALGFLGMIIGTIAGGWIGDRWGRRTGLAVSVFVFGAGTAATALTHGLDGIAACRFIAGIGLGAALPSATALISEFSPLRHRHIMVTAGIVCIPLGGVVGGLIAAPLLPTIGWRSLFLIGGILPFITGGLLILALPESPRFLLRRAERRSDLVHTLEQMGIDVPENATVIDGSRRPDGQRISTTELLRPAYRMDTIGLWIAFFFCFLAVYTVFNWAPSMLAALGFGLRETSLGLTVFNVGGVAGALIGAWSVNRFGSRTVMLAASLLAIASTAAMTIVGIRGVSMSLMILMLLAGAFINAVQSLMYALAAQVYPTDIRATGIGTTAGVGRSGAIVASLVGAILIDGGQIRYFGALAISMAIAGLGVVLVRRHIPSTTP